jgi:hypothetical protein
MGVDTDCTEADSLVDVRYLQGRAPDVKITILSVIGTMLFEKRQKNSQ